MVQFCSKYTCQLCIQYIVQSKDDLALLTDQLLDQSVYICGLPLMQDGGASGMCGTTTPQHDAATASAFSPDTALQTTPACDAHTFTVTHLAAAELATRLVFTSDAPATKHKAVSDMAALPSRGAPTFSPTCASLQATPLTKPAYPVTKVPTDPRRQPQTHAGQTPVLAQSLHAAIVSPTVLASQHLPLLETQVGNRFAQPSKVLPATSPKGIQPTCSARDMPDYLGSWDHHSRSGVKPDITNTMDAQQEGTIGALHCTSWKSGEWTMQQDDQKCLPDTHDKSQQSKRCWVERSPEEPHQKVARTEAYSSLLSTNDTAEHGTNQVSNADRL